MTIGARGLTAGLLLLMLCLGACTPTQQQQVRTARDHTLSWFGFARKPEVARGTAPAQAPATAAYPPDDQEPVPNAAPRTPVETEGVPPPAGGRSSGRS
jgi:hypothetical protein